MKKPWKLLLYALAALLGVWLTAKFLLPIGLPFLLGWSLARLVRPVTLSLHHRCRFPLWLSSLLCITLAAALLGGGIWLLGRWGIGQLTALGRRLPALLSSLSPSLSSLHTRLLHLAEKLPEPFVPAASQWLDRFFEGGSIVADTASDQLLSFAGRVLSCVPDLVLFSLTTLLSAYLFSSEGPRLRAAMERRLPEKWLRRIKSVVRHLLSALGGYLRTQLRLSGVVFLLLAGGLLLLRQKQPVLLALLIAVIDALPVFGVGTVLLPWGVLAFLRGSTVLGAGLFALYALCAVVRAFLEPKFLGKQIGLDPLLTLLALYAGFRLFGVLGMILLPVAAILLKQLYDIVESSEET